MKLLTKEIRKNLPKLYAQDGKGDEAIVHVKFFTPWSNWTWYATEGEPIFDDDGNEIDFRFFGYPFNGRGSISHNRLSYFIISRRASSKTSICGSVPIVRRNLSFNPTFSKYRTYMWC